MKNLFLFLIISLASSISFSQETISLEDFYHVLINQVDTGSCLMQANFNLSKSQKLEIVIQDKKTLNKVDLIFNGNIDYTESNLSIPSVIYYAERMDQSNNSKDTLSLRFEGQNLVSLTAANMIRKRHTLTGKTFWVGNPIIRCFDNW